MQRIRKWLLVVSLFLGVIIVLRLDMPNYIPTIFASYPRAIRTTNIDIEEFLHAVNRSRSDIESLRESLQEYKVNNTKTYKISLNKEEQLSLANTREARELKSWSVDYLKSSRRKSSDFSLMDKGPFSFLPDFKNPCWYNSRHKLRCLPFFFLAGFGKCGTSDVYHMLRAHPDFITTLKEPLWLFPKRFKEHLDFDWYTKSIADPLSHLLNSTKSLADINYAKRVRGSKIMGDLSTTTVWASSMWPILEGNTLPLEPELTNPDYVYHLNNKAKIVFILRNPIAKLYSSFIYFQYKTGLHGSRAFHDLVSNMVQEFNDCLELYSIRSCVYNPRFQKGHRKLTSGIYFIHLLEWFRVFPKEQILIIRLEDYMLHRKEHVQKILHFLTLRNTENSFETTLEKISKNNNKIFNANNYKNESMFEETRYILYTFYKPFNQALARLLHDQKFDYGPY